MSRDEKIAHVMSCVVGKEGLSSIRSDHVAQLVKNCADAVDNHWPTPPAAE